MFEAETPAERMRRRREAIEFYQHGVNWTNRMIAGDSLVIMNSLLEKEGMAGQVQMVYIDPPYGIKYGSNFQPFVDKRDVKDKKDEDLSQEPEMIKAFRDTWELGIHSYLTYLRNRLLLARELLADSGSVFVQISDENVHYVRILLDEVFGRDNFVCQICYQTAPYATSNTLPVVHDYLLWYAKVKKDLKYHTLFRDKAELDSLILDVRTKEEYASGHIPNAINIPNEVIGSEEIPELPDKDQLILVYCRSGNRSKQASKKLANLGYCILRC